MANTVTVTLYGATRLNNSVNGNPRWRLHTSEGDFITSSDHALNYEVENRTSKNGRWSWLDREVTLTLTRAGRVELWKLSE